MTNRTTATLMKTMAELKEALSLIPRTRIAVMTSAMQECGKVETDFHAEQVRRVDQIVSALNQFGRLRGDDVAHAREEGLGTVGEAGAGSMSHLPGDDVFGGSKRGPVIVGEPERHASSRKISRNSMK